MKNQTDYDAMIAARAPVYAAQRRSDRWRALKWLVYFLAAAVGIPAALLVVDALASPWRCRLAPGSVAVCASRRARRSASRQRQPALGPPSWLAWLRSRSSALSSRSTSGSPRALPALPPLLLPPKRPKRPAGPRLVRRHVRRCLTAALRRNMRRDAV